MTEDEDEMVRLHRWLNAHKFEQTLRDSEEQGSLACCRSCGCKQSCMIEQMNDKNKTIK